MIAAIFTIFILIFSVVVHEISHGFAAEKLGDPTARLSGRLTINPIPHIDPVNSIILPVVLWIATSGQFVFGSARPVPVNFANLRHPRRDMALVSLAGPGSNLLMAILCALPLRLGLFSVESYAYLFLLQVVLINLVLAIFNLIPVPPLDGSKILASVLPNRLLPAYFVLENLGLFFIFLLLFTGVIDLFLIPALHFAVNILIGPIF